MRALRLLMVVLFAVSAALQYDDPDPIPWMAIYAVAAVLTAVGPRLPAGRAVARLVAVTALVWAVLIAPGARGADWAEVFGATTMKTQAVEVARETLGLLIVCVWLVVLSFTLPRGAGLAASGRRKEEAAG